MRDLYSFALVYFVWFCYSAHLTAILAFGSLSSEKRLRLLGIDDARTEGTAEFVLQMRVGLRKVMRTA